MAQRVTRRTVGLDVSGLAASNDRKEVSQFIVEHFPHFNIHAVQFVGTIAKVTFVVEASKQQVICHQSISIHGVQCAVRGVVPVRRMYSFITTLLRAMRSPSVGNWLRMGLLKVLLSVIGHICQTLVTACGWSVWSAVRPSHATLLLVIFRSKFLMLASNRFAICVRPLAILRGCVP